MDDDDSVNPLPDLIGVIGALGELYPSLGPRLRQIERSANPELRGKIELLRAAVLSRDDVRRGRVERAWSLTATEARLAIHLTDGGSVRGYAELYGVAVGTVRSQLKSVFAKTGVNRQSALSALITQKPGAFPNRDPSRVPPVARPRGEKV